MQYWDSERRRSTGTEIAHVASPISGYIATIDQQQTLMTFLPHYIMNRQRSRNFKHFKHGRGTSVFVINSCFQSA